MPDALRAEDLHKSFGDVKSLDGLDLAAAEGSVLGLLGPNGAGKTTAVRVLATLLEPDSGHARICGLDVVGQARQVRRMIGLTGQFAAVDGMLTGLENLELIGRLGRLGRRETRRRARELLERLGLADVADRQVRTYSGGMQRRLDLAASIIGRPRVLFLDEPTTGLDLPSRRALWTVIDELVADGTTILLTTQYLEEADRLSDRIVVLDRGRAITSGTPGELKAELGGPRVELRLTDPTALPAAVHALPDQAVQGSPQPDERTGTLVVPVRADDDAVIPALLAALQENGIAVAELVFRQPTLDDVFLAVTSAETTAAPTKGPTP
ncbi:ATP-binding cassette domain-containing protein [Saccharopolyspora shandongensis]|uniref:ATP-binding cassette domain-containing protein n=1 Tax=Saccharopolyspora shandongensis TaxID=418495 RepID=UPI0033CB1519